MLLLAAEGQEAAPHVLSRIQTLVQRELLFLYFQCAPPPLLHHPRATKDSAPCLIGSEGVCSARQTGRQSRRSPPGSKRGMHGCRRAALTNATSVNRFVATAVLEDMRVPLGSEGPDMWRKVAEAMQLTREQRADIVQLWRAFR